MGHRLRIMLLLVVIGVGWSGLATRANAQAPITATIKGRVVDQNGQPLAGATVQDNAGFSNGRYDGWRFNDFSGNATVSDGNGSFKFDNLPLINSYSGQYGIKVSKSGYGIQVKHAITLSAGIVDIGDIQLAPGTPNRLFGRATNLGRLTNHQSDGEYVLYLTNDSDFLIENKTKNDGNFSFNNIPQGSYSVVLRQGIGDSQVLFTVKITEAANQVVEKNINVALIGGYIYRPDGTRPFSGAKVQSILRPRVGPDATVTNSLGLYQGLALHSPGELTKIQASAPDELLSAEKTLVLDPNQDNRVDITLKQDPYPLIKGRLFTVSGTPAPGVQMSLYDNKQEVLSRFITDDNGYYHLTVASANIHNSKAQSVQPLEIRFGVGSSESNSRSSDYFGYLTGEFAGGLNQYMEEVHRSKRPRDNALYFSLTDKAPSIVTQDLKIAAQSMKSYSQYNPSRVNYRLNVNVFEPSTTPASFGKRISGATVTLRSTDGRITKTAKTAVAGKYSQLTAGFVVPGGHYTVTTSAPGFQSVTHTFIINHHQYDGLLDDFQIINLSLKRQ